MPPPPGRRQIRTGWTSTTTPANPARIGRQIQIARVFYNIDSPPHHPAHLHLPLLHLHQPLPRASPPPTVRRHPRMNRSWLNGTLFSREYINGVREFMSLVQRKFGEDEDILCPCSRCLNQKCFHQAIVEKHILVNGMESTYIRWIHHGENSEVHVFERPVDVHDHVDPSIHGSGVIEDDNNGDDRFDRMLQDLCTAEEQDKEDAENEDGNNTDDDNESFYRIVMEEAKRHLYPGCTKFSRLSFVIKLLHMKSLYRISNSAFTAILKLLAEAFPEGNILPKSYNAAKSLLKELGLGYESIHVCFNNCVLFRKKYAKLDNCPVCGLSRWKDAERKKIPQKVLRYFPLVPRLKRMFVTFEAAEAAQWHELKRKRSDKEMSHPADGEAWKDFDREYPDFAKDPRNLRLGLATDGFNPFSEQNTRYSMWPIFVVPYNLPPWACMEESNFMMALLIPGPKSPGKDFDIFLEPLVEDLLDLWKGVPAYDARSGKKFTLRAAVLWCIHDYPALSTLSGRTTKGYFACIHCDKHPLSYGLRNKIGYFGHFRYLPKGHRLRRNNEFAGLHESNDPPSEFSTEELLAELEKVKEVRPGKQQVCGKRKRSELDRGHVRIWTRMVSLWKLPYWKKLKLRHNLDVMHIEKNICESLIGTILNISGKTKDTVKARLDLKDLGIKKELQFREDGDSCEMPHARYTLSTEQKKAFCDFFQEVKFPDGFASNISRCLNSEGTKLQGLKTHDCHILLQRILPAAIRGFLDKDIYEAIAELGGFFRELCSRTLNKDVLSEMKKEIPIILVKLEKIFPPAFFDVMVHLAVHLPDDALLRGPVQYGWMYPIERRLYTLKRYVRNRARPEGSIAEAYIADECLTFCSRYMDDVETRFNREPRNKGFSDEEAYGVDVFGHGVNFTSAPELVYDENGIDQMVWYVLNNCSQVEKYVKMFRDELESKGVPNIERMLRQGFQIWFRNHKGSKDNNRRTIDMAPGGIKPRTKRVFADQVTTRNTRSKKSIAQPDTSVPPSDIYEPPPSLSHLRQAGEVAGSIEGHRQTTNGPAQVDNTRMANESDAIAPHNNGHNQIGIPNGHNQNDIEDDGLDQFGDNMTNQGEGITQPDGENRMGNKGVNVRRERGLNMGHGLQRMNRARRGKLPVVITEGRIRPVTPILAAKFATECNIAVRNHVPVLKSWKEYDNHPGIFELFKGKLSAKFDINTDDAAVKNACLEMMKKALRQQRYRLKKQYFDPFPLHLVRKTSPIKSTSDDQWNDLVEHWKGPKKMLTCEHNKDNRGRVKFHQTTGSRSYMVHVENLGDKYIDQEPDALDLFKECHYSKKKQGYTSTVQLAITQMENKRSTPREGEQPVSMTQVVSDVLAENTKKNRFLQNVGIQNAQPRSSEQNVEAQLEAERTANAELRSLVNIQREQMDVLSKQLKEAELIRTREQEEMKKKQDAMDAKLELMLSQIQRS
ncbi:hypothetical protein U9M48_020091 [Paspalum notatum var. saurae]|uniref:Transposase n=1 Tax=Paspalum notatum var. saurae TaxID=547442 RepID=A0AAQ3TG81_PASNO